MATYGPGDLVAVDGLPPRQQIGMVTEVIDCGPGGVYYYVRVPPRYPHPYRVDEIHAATDEEKAAHHPSWLRSLVEDRQQRQRVEAELRDADPQRSPRGRQGGDS